MLWTEAEAEVLSLSVRRMHASRSFFTTRLLFRGGRWVFEREFDFFEAVESVKISQGDCKHRSRKLTLVHGFHDSFFSPIKVISL